MEPFNSILKAYLKGIWDSVKGVSLIFIVIRDTYNHYKNQSKKIENETEESSSSSNATTSATKRAKTPNRRELNKLKEEQHMLKRIVQCGTLNGLVFGCSIFFFECILLPIIRNFLSWMFTNNPGADDFIGSYIITFLSIVFGMIWVLPLFVLSKIVNSLWFQDIADSAYKFRKGKPQLVLSLSVVIADTLFSLLVQSLFLIQSMLVNLLPFNALMLTIISNVHLCLLYSLYSFEYKWCNVSWELHRRLTYIENNWPYFLGFGTILTLVTQVTSSIFIGGCIFAVCFPFNILSANEATPVTKSCDFPLKLFSLVVAISNALFNKTVRPANVPQSRAAIEAAQTAANANDIFQTIRQQTPPVNASPLHRKNHSSVHHSSSQRSLHSSNR